MKPLRDVIRDSGCKKCGLWKYAQSVDLIGEGPYPTEIMFIGKNPGRREDDINKPFSGKSGRQILDPALEELDIFREEVFISNAVHCLSPDNRDPTKEEMKACSYWLDKELSYVRPKKIICLGSIALKGFMKKYNMAFEPNLGKILVVNRDWGEVQVLVTYHPARVLRFPFEKPYFLNHLKHFLVEKERTGTSATRWDMKSFLSIFKGKTTLDIETEDLRIYKPKVLSIAVSPRKGTGFWLDLDSGKDWRDLHSILFNGTEAIIGHNLKFDLRTLITTGYLSKNILYEEKFFDTLLAYNVLDENCPDKSLKSLSYHLTSMIKYEMPETFDNIDEVRTYNCLDVDANKRLYNYTIKKLEKEPSLWTPLMIDMRTSAVVVSMEMEGIKVDKGELEDIKDKHKKKLNTLSRKVPVENINSPKQVAKMLTTELGLELPLTENENPSCSESVLKDLQSSCEDKEAKVILNNIIEYRRYKKNSELIENIEESMDPDGFSHPLYFIAKREDFEKNRDESGGTLTGRLSSKEPNLQQTPRDKEELEQELNPRRLFIPRHSDGIIISSDFAQIEMVFAGIIYQEPKLVEMYDEGEDIHLRTASEVFEVKIKNVTKDQRKFAKTVNFGILYGISEFGLAKRLGWGTNEALRYIKKYFKVFPDLKFNIEEAKFFIIKHGYIENYFHRKRRLPGASFDTNYGRTALRQGINSPIQGTAADLTKICMWELFKLLRNREVLIIGNLHDEIVKESPVKRKKEVIEAVKEVFSNPPLKEYGVKPFPIKLKGESKVGKNWLELTEVYKI